MKFRRRLYEEQIMNKMENLYHRNKNEFWNFLKSMKSRKKCEELPELDILIDHFKTLFIKRQTTNLNTPKNLTIKTPKSSIS